jgi:ABC-type multidrug transport system ATPase subunit
MAMMTRQCPPGFAVPHSAAVLQAAGIEKRFGRKVVLDGVDLEVRAGEVVALVGENGAGKSTLLGICAGLLAPDAGMISTAGAIGLCPQNPGLLDLLTADEHLVLFGAAVGLSRDAALADGRRLLDDLGFPRSERSIARELSGGNRQKLNLTLARLGDRRLLLLDEPYQGFDHGAYVDFWEHVGRWAATGIGVLVVTHMLAELDRADRVVELRVPTAGAA